MDETYQAEYLDSEESQMQIEIIQLDLESQAIVESLDFPKRSISNDVSDLIIEERKTVSTPQSNY